MFIKKLDKKLEELYSNLKDKNSRIEYINRLREIAKEDEELLNWHKITKNKKEKKKMHHFNGSALIKENCCEYLQCLVKIKHNQIKDLNFIPKCDFGVFGVCHIIKGFIIGRTVDEILADDIKELIDFHNMLQPEFQHCFDIAMKALRTSILNYLDDHYEKIIEKDRNLRLYDDAKNHTILSQVSTGLW